MSDKDLLNVFNEANTVYSAESKGSKHDYPGGTYGEFYLVYGEWLNIQPEYDILGDAYKRKVYNF